MKYAIIAAGEGSRLAEEGVAEPKPLVRLGSECLIDRLLRIFTANGASEIAVICNEQSPQVRHHLEDVVRNGLDGRAIPLRLVVKTTPSSMHSLYELSGLLAGEPFVLTTVDTIFRESEFTRYVETFTRMMTAAGSGASLDGLMGVTDYVDDEKPLYVEVGDGWQIRGFHDTPDYLSVAGTKSNQPFVSAGIYGLSPHSLDTLSRCMERGEHRMRNFQRALVADGFRLDAWLFSKVLDIDHASDIEKAEDFLKTEDFESAVHI